MMGRRTAVVAVAKGETKHYRSISEAAEDNKVTKVEIWRAIQRGLRVNGFHFDYEIMEVFDGDQKRS
jgi:hypothetical protein